jgi:lipoate-protein ligase A
VIVERASAAELIPRPLELLDATIADGVPRGSWTRATFPALVLGSGQRPPEGWLPPDGLALVRRGTGGGAVVCDSDYLMLDIALPPGDARILDDVTESYRWLAVRLLEALGRLGVEGLGWMEPTLLRQRDEAAREAARIACFAGHGPYEVLDARGRKLVGLAQRRRRGAALLQAAAYLAGDRSALADLLWLNGAARDDLRARLSETAVLGAIGPRLPEVLGDVWAPL